MTLNNSKIMNEFELKAYRDHEASKAFYIHEGVAKTVKDFKRAGASWQLIAKVTGLTKEQIERL